MIGNNVFYSTTLNSMEGMAMKIRENKIRENIGLINIIVGETKKSPKPM